MLNNENNNHNWHSDFWYYFESIFDELEYFINLHPGKSGAILGCMLAIAIHTCSWQNKLTFWKADNITCAARTFLDTSLIISLLLCIFGAYRYLKNYYNQRQRNTITFRYVNNRSFDANDPFNQARTQPPTPDNSSDDSDDEAADNSNHGILHQVWQTLCN